MARRVVFVVVLVLLLGNSCAEAAPPSLADGTVERALPASIWPENPALVESVSCPDLDHTVIAQSSTCTMSLDGEPVTVDITVDELGAVTAAVRESLFVTSSVEDAIARRLQTDLSMAEAPQVDCTRAVLLAAPGVMIDCEATRANGDILRFVVELLDDTGLWTLRFAP